MIPVDMAQYDPIHIIRLQTSVCEAPDYIMVTAYWMPRFDVFSNWWRVCGKRFAESEIEEETGGRGILLCNSAMRWMLY